MEQTFSTFSERLVQRIDYLESLLNLHKISFETDPELQQLIENITRSQVTLSSNQLKRTLAERYSRQMFVPEISTEGQEKLKNAKVLIVGAGGIGSPAALYLAGAGIGKLGIIDGDKVEESNLHRQIIHSNVKLGINKAKSAKSAVLEFNPYVKVETYEEWFTPENAMEIIKDYDIVLDASDNAKARYLVNDACILSKKILVSGAAIKWDGQLTVFGKDDGPCYRCLYPECPHPSMMMSCGDGGVVGMIPGLIGILEALEAVRVILGTEEILCKKLLLFDGKTCTFKKVKIRGRSRNCVVCGEDPSLKDIKKFDYDSFVGLGKCSASLYVNLPQENNVNWTDFLQVYKSQDFGVKNQLVDVRPIEQFKITSIDKADNIPYSAFMLMNQEQMLEKDITKDKTVFVLCRRGNTSRNATKHLLDMGYKDVKNILGGMNEYSKDFDPNVPIL